MRVDNVRYELKKIRSYLSSANPLYAASRGFFSGKENVLNTIFLKLEESGVLSTSLVLHRNFAWKENILRFK